jgi:hypothetical protein
VSVAASRHGGGIKRRAQSTSDRILPKSWLFFIFSIQEGACHA